MENELISRKQAIEKIDDWGIEKDEIEDDRDRGYYQGIRRAIRIIEGLPKANVIIPIRHGSWLFDKTVGAMGTYCSVCGARFPVAAHAENYNGCPMCFAVMKEV